MNIIKSFILPNVNSKYVAICEGDDYWTDPYKLQKQVDMLEKNVNSYMCVHGTQEIFEDGSPTGVFFPSYQINSEVIESRDFLSMRYPFHTSSYLMRADKWCEYIGNPPEFRNVCDVGDEPCLLY